MTVFFVICMVILTLLLLLWILFACLLLPLWILIHCAISTLSTRAKALWIIVMLLVWPIGSWVYGFFVSKKRLFRWSAGVSFFLFLILAAGLVMGLPIVFKEGEKRGSRVMLQSERLSMSDVSQEDRGKLNTALETLQGETSARGNWLSRYKALERATNLYDLFDLYAEDNQLTAAEYRDWMGTYNMRNLVDQDALEEHMRQLKYKRRKVNDK